MAKQWLKKLKDLEGAVVERYSPHSQVIQTPSPSVNSTFGNTWGLPLGYTLVLFGPPKGGKSILCHSMIGQMHKDFDDGIAIKFDTEMREEGQLTPAQMKLWGIDEDRYLAYSVNSPSLIFDRIEKDIAAQCQEGMPLKLVIIDSLTGIAGRRAENADTIDTQLIGDHALTVQEGLKRILPVQRKYRFALILTDQVRAQMDQTALRQNPGAKLKMKASFGVQHYAEYFMMVEPNLWKSGRQSILEEEFVDEDKKDIRGGGEKTAHKITVTMKDSSLGPKGRVGEFTLNYDKGIVSVEEEVFLLGRARGVIEQLNNTTYAYKDRKFPGGKPGILDALRMDGDLQKEIIKDMRQQDIEGKFVSVEEKKVKDEESA